MHSTTTKALLQQIAHCDGHVFLIQPWEDNHCSLEKNVQKLTHTSSKGFYPRDWKLLQFYDRRCPWKEQKKSLLLNSLQVKLFSITYHLHPLNIDLESLRIDLSFGKKTECKLLSNNSEKTRAQKSARDGWLHKAQSLNCRSRHEDPDFLFCHSINSRTQQTVMSFFINFTLLCSINHFILLICPQFVLFVCRFQWWFLVDKCKLPLYKWSQGGWR